MALSDLLRLEDVNPSLKASSKKHALHELAAKAATDLGVDEHSLIQAVYEREKLGTTSLGQGVAIPHARISGLKQPRAFFARLSSPIDYEASDEEPVDLLVLLLAPQDDSNDHLKALSQIARQFKDSDMLAQLRGAEGQEALYALLTSD